MFLVFPFRHLKGSSDVRASAISLRSERDQSMVCQNILPIFTTARKLLLSKRIKPLPDPFVGRKIVADLTKFSGKSFD